MPLPDGPRDEPTGMRTCTHGAVAPRKCYPYPTVDVGQYFMTKDTEEFCQFTESVACREYTLPRDEKSSDPKGWIGGNTKIRPVLEVTTSYLQGKYGVEIKN